MAKKRRSLAFWLKLLLMGGGVFLAAMCVLAFTTAPFWAYYRLGTSNSTINTRPDAIVLLSGAGMPSESSLIRAYFTAQLSAKFPAARVILAVPGDTADPLSDPRLLASELRLRGVKSDRIFFEPGGNNTRGQALAVAGMRGIDKGNPVALVTSPEHMQRAVLAFRKCGFAQVSGMPTFEQSLAGDLRFDDKSLKGNSLAPPIGNRLQVRYQFWNHLRFEILVMREYVALAYYKLRGWI